MEIKLTNDEPWYAERCAQARGHLERMAMILQIGGMHPWDCARLFAATGLGVLIANMSQEDAATWLEALAREVREDEPMGGSA